MYQGLQKIKTFMAGWWHGAFRRWLHKVTVLRTWGSWEVKCPEIPPGFTKRDLKDGRKLKPMKLIKLSINSWSFQRRTWMHLNHIAVWSLKQVVALHHWKVVDWKHKGDTWKTLKRLAVQGCTQYTVCLCVCHHWGSQKVKQT